MNQHLRTSLFHDIKVQDTAQCSIRQCGRWQESILLGIAVLNEDTESPTTRAVDSHKEWMRAVQVNVLAACWLITTEYTPPVCVGELVLERVVCILAHTIHILVVDVHDHLDKLIVVNKALFSVNRIKSKELKKLPLAQIEIFYKEKTNFEE